MTCISNRELEIIKGPHGAEFMEDSGICDTVTHRVAVRSVKLGSLENLWCCHRRRNLAGIRGLRREAFEFIGRLTPEEPVYLVNVKGQGVRKSDRAIHDCPVHV